MEPECILAIDLGTSGPKVALVTTQGEVSSATRVGDAGVPLPGWEVSTSEGRIRVRGAGLFDGYLSLDGFLAQEIEPCCRWEGVASTQGEAERVALWLGASLGVFHAGSAGHLPELRKHAESTYRQHAAVAGDVESLVRTAWANYAKQVEGLAK